MVAELEDPTWAILVFVGDSAERCKDLWRVIVPKTPNRASQCWIISNKRTMTRAHILCA